MVRLCIFDLDGTLADSLADLADCCNAVLTEDELPTHAIAEYRYFVGNGIPKLIERILPENMRKKEIILAYKARFDRQYQKHCLDQTLPYEGILELLAECKKQKVRLSVLSNKADTFAKYICTHIFAENSFDMVCGQTENIPKKPAPDGIFSLLQSLHVSAEEAILIGDSDVDIKTAKNAGIRSIGACWGFRGREELQKAGADFLAETPKEALMFIQQK